MIRSTNKKFRRTAIAIGSGVLLLGAVALVGYGVFGASPQSPGLPTVPLALAALGVGAGLSSTFAALMPLRWALTALSLVGLAAGWWAYVRRRRTCAADRSCTVTLPSRATPIMLTIGTTLTLTALIWDRIEATLIKALS